MPLCAVPVLAEVYPSNRVSGLFHHIELHTGVSRKLQTAQDRKQIRKVLLSVVLRQHNLLQHFP